MKMPKLLFGLLCSLLFTTLSFGFTPTLSTIDTLKTDPTPFTNCGKKEKKCKGKQAYEDGTYEGEFKYGEPHGWGTFKFGSGDIYMGEFLDGKRDGHGQQNFSNDDNYAGEWRGGLIHGKGVYLWADKSKYVGTFVEGIMQGKGIITLANGESYDGEWHNGLAEGQGEFNRQDGSRYVGHHKAGKRDGSGVITFRTGDVFIGKWKNGLANKKGTFQFNNGDKYMCIWEDGEMSGEATYIMVNGKEIKGNLVQLENATKDNEELQEAIGPNIGISWYTVAMEQMQAKKYKLAKENLEIARRFVTPSSDLNKLIYEQLQIIEAKEKDDSL